MKHILLAFLAGSLVAGSAAGAIGYFKITTLNTEITLLQQKLKKQLWYQENISKSQASLTEELNGLKEKKNQEFDQTLGALMQAKENADIVALYDIGLKALQEKDYPRAFFSLSQVMQANPQFKDIQKQFPLAQKAYDSYQQKQQEEKLQNTYAQAVDLQHNNQLSQAQIYYQRVVDLNPHYKDARTRLYTVTRYLAVKQRTQEFLQKQAWLEATYQLGSREQLNGRFAQAKEAFQSILAYAPAYKDTARRIRIVNAHLPKTQQVSQPGNAQTAGNSNCYEKGVALGKCASLGAESPACSPAEISRLTKECKNNPEFAKGLKATVNSNPGSPGGLGENGTSPAAALLRDMPNMLNNL